MLAINVISFELGSHLDINLIRAFELKITIIVRTTVIIATDSYSFSNYYQVVTITVTINIT